MAEYKVKKGVTSFKKIPVEDWSTDQMCSYFRDEFKSKYGIDTRRPIGQIKIHINKRTISNLFRLEGRSIDIHPNELFKQFIIWLVDKKQVHNFRVWLFSKQDVMVDYLDERAKRLMDKNLGSVEDFKKQEEKKVKDALEYFKGGGSAKSRPK